jgi:hypothetical protein
VTYFAALTHRDEGEQNWSSPLRPRLLSVTESVGSRLMQGRRIKCWNLIPLA